MAILRLSDRASLSSVTARPLTELVDDGWARALAPVSDQVASAYQPLKSGLGSAVLRWMS